MTALQRILNALPAYFDRDPAAEVGLSLVVDATTAMTTIVNRTLTVRVVGGSAQNVALSLSGHTLESLAQALNGLTGYTATVVALDPTRSALCLIEIPEPRNVVADSQILAFTSLLWAIFLPLAWALEDLQERIRQGLDQMSLKTAGGVWIDLWGQDYYGGIYRLFGEADRAFADRIIKEVLRWRLNAHAIEQIIWEDLGIDATIRNLHDDAWVVGYTGKTNTPLGYGYLAGRKYSRTTFEVTVSEISEALVRIVECNRAAGTFPFYRLVAVGGGAGVGDAELQETHNRILTTVPIGADLVWTIGLDPLGTSLGMPGNVGVSHVYTLVTGPEAVLGGILLSFILGTAELGGDYGLGDAAAGAVILSDDASVALV